jgi:spore maturation protein CgeB
VAQVRRWGALFISAANPARRAVSAELLPLLRQAPCRWIGQGWGFGEAALPPAEVPAALGSARIVLSPLIAVARRSPLELTHRVYEAAACGAFQLCSWSPVARAAFSRRALVLAADGQELCSLYLSYLHREDERLRIAEAALEEVLAAHTVFHRAAQLLDWAAARAGRPGPVGRESPAV